MILFFLFKVTAYWKKSIGKTPGVSSLKVRLTSMVSVIIDKKEIGGIAAPDLLVMDSLWIT